MAGLRQGRGRQRGRALARGQRPSGPLPDSRTAATRGCSAGRTRARVALGLSDPAPDAASPPLGRCGPSPSFWRVFTFTLKDRNSVILVQI